MHYPSHESAFYELPGDRSIYTRAEPERVTTGSSSSDIVPRGFRTLGLSVTAIATTILLFFLYDSFTYHGEPSAEDIVVARSALEPRRGGPKNLPIVDFLMGEYESDDMLDQSNKPKLVILGTGWGSISLLKRLQPGDYHVTVLSPANSFLFTPMLPSATMGTVSFRSLIEPIRRTVKRVHGHFLNAKADDVLLSDRLVEVSRRDSNGELQRFYVPYDKLVIAVGCEANPHGVRGLEYCYSLKALSDARDIRNKVLENLELASLPTTTDDERKRLLSFVICGGGPTGVEFAAELFDMLNEDLIYSFPRILRNEISVHIIQSRGHILNTYDEAISKYTEEHFARDGIDVLVDSRVKEIQKDRVLFTQTEDGNATLKEVPMGFCLWSTGVSRAKLCQTLSDKLQEQNNKRALETDTHLRLIGSPPGEVYAIGDCATVKNDLASHIVSFLRETSLGKGEDPENARLTFREWTAVARKIKEHFPQAVHHLRRLDQLFEQYEQDHTGTLGYDELYKLLQNIDAKLTSLPATAQRAHQQGVYLGRKLSRLAKVNSDPLREAEHDGVEEKVCKPFHYRHLGSLAYIGNSAVFNVGGFDITGGIMAVYLWRSVYFAQSVGLRTKCMLAMDWVKRGIFGRDLMYFC